MALATYADLKTTLARWLNFKTSEMSDVIDDLIVVGESRIEREAKCADQETALAGTISASVLAVPANYRSMKFAYVDTTPVQTLEPRPVEWIYANYGYRSAPGKPKFFARVGSNFVFGPSPDSGYSIVGVYYQKMGPLATTAHALFTNNPDLYLFGCAIESEMVFERDSRMPIWEAKYKAILAMVNGFDQMQQSSGGPMRVRIG